MIMAATNGRTTNTFFQKQSTHKDIFCNFAAKSFQNHINMRIFKTFCLGCLFVSGISATAKAEWTDIGKGVYYEGLLTYYGEEMGVPGGMSWAVTIEENSETKGLYRLAPYSGNNPVAELMSYGDDTYMVIHAEDPTKVWMEDFDTYDSYFCFTHMVPESGWEGTPASYGTLADGVITFPPMCLATIDITDPENQWHSANREGEFKIVLPEAAGEIEDYSLYLDYKYCGEDNKVPVTVTAGQSISSLMFLLEPGVIYADESTETNNDLDAESIARVLTEGSSFNSGENLVECTAQGVHSLMIVGLDNNGEPRTGKIAYIYGDFSDSDEWNSLGKVTYNEDLFAGYYDDLEQVELQAELEVNKLTPGFYRLVNPYADYEYNWLEGHDYHNHYIYIHAENPDAVWVENSPIGVDFADGMGEARITSNVAIALEAGYTLEEAILAAGEELGCINGNTIEFTHWGLWVAQTGWYNGYWTSTGQNFRVTLPDSSGVDSVIAEGADNSEAQYYNLHGILIDRPTHGVYIVKRGSTVTKQIIK